MGETTDASSDDERRIAPRVRMLKRARVVFNNRFSTIDCVVRNLSSTGALLTVETSVPMPKEFEISIGDGDLRPARLVYRRETFAGIHFLDVGAEENLPDAPQWRADDPDTTLLPPGEDVGIARIEHGPLPRAVRERFAWNAFG